MMRYVTNEVYTHDAEAEDDLLPNVLLVSTEMIGVNDVTEQPVRFSNSSLTSVSSTQNIRVHLSYPKHLFCRCLRVQPDFGACSSTTVDDLFFLCGK